MFRYSYACASLKLLSLSTVTGMITTCVGDTRGYEELEMSENSSNCPMNLYSHGNWKTVRNKAMVLFCSPWNWDIVPALILWSTIETATSFLKFDFIFFSRSVDRSQLLLGVVCSSGEAWCLSMLQVACFGRISHASQAHKSHMNTFSYMGKIGMFPIQLAFFRLGRSRLNIHLPLSTVYCVFFQCSLPLLCFFNTVDDRNCWTWRWWKCHFSTSNLPTQICSRLVTSYHPRTFCAVHLPTVLGRTTWVIRDCLVCFIYFPGALGFFSGTRNSLMVCTQTGNWSFILQDSTISWGKVNIIYMFIPHDFSYAYLYIFFSENKS